MLATLRDEFACDGLLFGPVHEDSKNYLLLLESARPEDRRLFYRPNQPYIDTRTVDFERFSRGKKKSTLSDARRCIRRLSELGKLEFSIDSPDVDLMENVQILCRQQSKRFAGQHVFSATENWNGFLPELAMRGVTGGVNELAALRLNGELIASHLGFLCKGRRHYYFPGHVVEYLKYSPAKVLMLFLIEQTFKGSS
jgi:CelD/BcsL family acetyltransferase involved in cellulose biosynthesis